MAGDEGATLPRSVALDQLWPSVSAYRPSGDAFDLSVEPTDPIPTPAEMLVLQGQERAHRAAGWAWAVGIGLGVLVYCRAYTLPRLLMFIPLMKSLRAYLRGGLFIDAVGRYVFAGSVLLIGRAAAWADDNVIDPLVRGVAVGATGLSRVMAAADDAVVDGAVAGVAAFAGETGALARMPQSGRIRGYVRWLTAAAAVVAAGTVILVLLARG